MVTDAANDNAPSVCWLCDGEMPATTHRLCTACVASTGCCAACAGNGLLGSMRPFGAGVAFVDFKCTRCNGTGEEPRS